MSSPAERLAELGIELPAAPAPAAAYQAWKRTGDLVFTAGQLPVVDGTLVTTGKLGDGLTTEHGASLARTAAINVLAVAQAAAGSLDDVEVIKITVFVASTPDFTEQHLVANGASQLIADVLGERGIHSRSAVGVPVLPLDSPVEIEAILRVGA